MGKIVGSGRNENFTDEIGTAAGRKRAPSVAPISLMKYPSRHEYLPLVSPRVLQGPIIWRAGESQLICPSPVKFLVSYPVYDRESSKRAATLEGNTN